MVEVDENKFAPIEARVSSMDLQELRLTWDGLHAWRGIVFKAMDRGEVADDAVDLLDRRFHRSIELSRLISARQTSILLSAAEALEGKI